MKNNQMGYDMIYLCGCAINDITPQEEKIKSMNLEKLYEVSRFHSTFFAVYSALEQSKVFAKDCEQELKKRWLQDKEQAVRRSLLFDIERESILSFLEANGIWYLPLKGVLLKDYYPHPAMRYMSDNDILYDTSFQKQVREYMLKNGYEVESYDTGNADTYHKKPIYNFEMHRILFEDLMNPKWVEYYDIQKIKERMLKDENNQFGFHFSDEDFYIYFIAHAYKHYEEMGGNGIRYLMDCYLYLKEKNQSLNWEYIEIELRKLELTQFEQDSRELSFILFADPEHWDEEQLTEAQREQIEYILESGTYGIAEHGFVNRFKTAQERNNTKGKLGYYMHRMFPSMKWYKTYVPFCYRHKWAIPFYCVFRLVRAVLFRRKNIQAEMEVVKNMEEK